MVFHKNILVLHGWGKGSQSWLKVKQFFKEKGYKVSVPDLPGFGKNEAPKDAWGVNEYVKWVNDYIQNLNLTQIILIGHSFGGRIAIKFSAKYPEKILALILISSAGIKHRKNLLERASFKIVKLLRIFSFFPGYEFFRNFFYKFILRKTDYILAKGTMKGTFKKIIEEDLTPFLSKIRMPTLILWGNKDKITPIRDAYIIKKGIENSKLEILEDLGHNPHFTNPEIISKKIIEFIKTI